VFGDDDKHTMVTTDNLALTHADMENYDTALLLMTETLEQMRRLLAMTVRTHCSR
jgi:hypothetical protein